MRPENEPWLNEPWLNEPWFNGPGLMCDFEGGGMRRDKLIPPTGGRGSTIGRRRRDYQPLFFTAIPSIREGSFRVAIYSSLFS